MPLYLIVLFIFVALVFVIWLGLRIQPKPFPIPDLVEKGTQTVPLPEGLPTPVERYFRTVYGDHIPVINTVVISSHGRMRPFGVWLPARFVFTHNAGQDYRHYIEATFFGLPFLKVNEGYIDGKSFFESPMGTYYDDPNSNQGANLALWAEGAWFPALWLTHPKARWQAVDDTTAILHVPFEDTEENFVVRFNPHTAQVETMEAMRFQSPNDKDKVLWITSEVRAENKPPVGYATWMDVGKPWAGFIVDEMRFNLDVSEYIRARGK